MKALLTLVVVIAVISACSSNSSSEPIGQQNNNPTSAGSGAELNDGVTVTTNETDNNLTVNENGG